MNQLKILIVEDEPLYADQLEMLVDQLEHQHVATVDNSDQALMKVKSVNVDLILMDVHIRGDYDGIELADMILSEQYIPIIFITSLADDMTFKRASRTRPLHFLLKPFNLLQLKRTIEISVQQITQRPKTAPISTDATPELFADNHFYIKTQQKLHRVATSDILFIEADGHHCYIHTREKKYIVRLSMVEIEKKLATQSFFKTHRSFLINLKEVKTVDLKDDVVIVGDKHVPLSKRKRDVLLKTLDWI